MNLKTPMKTSLKLEHHTIKYTPYILNQNTTSRTLPNNLTLNLTSTQLRTTTPFATQKRSKKSRTNTEIETPTDCLLLFFEWVIKRVSRQLIMSTFFECKIFVGRFENAVYLQTWQIKPLQIISGVKIPPSLQTSQFKPHKSTHKTVIPKRPQSTLITRTKKGKIEFSHFK